MILRLMLCTALRLARQEVGRYQWSNGHADACESTENLRDYLKKLFRGFYKRRKLTKKEMQHLYQWPATILEHFQYPHVEANITGTAGETIQSAQQEEDGQRWGVGREEQCQSRDDQQNDQGELTIGVVEDDAT